MNTTTTRILAAIVFFFVAIAASGQTPNYAQYDWQRPQTFSDTIYTDNDGNSSLWSNVGVQNAELAQAAFNAELIRVHSGIPDFVDIGLIDGSFVGSTDGLATSARISITSQAEAITASSGGSGTKSDPYVIRGKKIINTGGSSSAAGFNWNDPDGNYWIRLSNCKIAGWVTQQVYTENSGGLIVDSCLIYGTGDFIAGGNNTRGIDALGGELIVQNSIFDGLGNNGIDVETTGKVIIENVEARRDTGNATNNPFFFIFQQAESADSLIIRNVYMHDLNQYEGLLFMRNELPLIIEKCQIENIESTASTVHVIYFAYQSDFGNLRNKKTIKYNQVRANTHKSFFKVDKSVSNVEISHNDVRYRAEDNNPTILFLGSYNSGINIDGNKIDQVSIADEGGNNSEPIYLFQSEYSFVQNNYVPVSRADGYELYNPRSHNHIVNNVVDVAAGQIVDLFSDVNSNPLNQTGNVIQNIYGTCNDVGVLITNTKGVVIQNAYVITTRDTFSDGTNIPMIQIEQRTFKADTIPTSVAFLGGCYPSSYAASGVIFNTRGNINDTANTAVFSDGGFIYTYNPSAELVDRLNDMDTTSTTNEGIFTKWTFRQPVYGWSVTYSDASDNLNEDANLSFQLQDRVRSNTSGVSGADQVLNIISLTQAEYNAITTPNPSTLYIITD